MFAQPESKDRDGQAPYVVLLKDNKRLYLLIDAEGEPITFDDEEEAQAQCQRINNGEEDPEPETQSDGCFITTACQMMLADEFADNHVYLDTLRQHRDRLAAAHPELADRVREYYEVSPSVVEAINTQQNSREIYQHVFNDMVKPTNEFLNRGDDNSAIDLYYTEFLKLKNEFYQPASR